MPWRPCLCRRNRPRSTPAHPPISKKSVSLEGRVADHGPELHEPRLRLQVLYRLPRLEVAVAHVYVRYVLLLRAPPHLRQLRLSVVVYGLQHLCERRASFEVGPSERAPPGGSTGVSRCRGTSNARKTGSRTVWRYSRGQTSLPAARCPAPVKHPRMFHTLGFRNIDYIMLSHASGGVDHRQVSHWYVLIIDFSESRPQDTRGAARCRRAYTRGVQSLRVALSWVCLHWQDRGRP